VEVATGVTSSLETTKLGASALIVIVAGGMTTLLDSSRIGALDA
jgi:hypothetical protein